MYGAGSALGLAGATGMAVGLHELTKPHPRKIEKREHKAIDFAAEGLQGTQDALTDRVNSARHNHVSPKARVAVAATGLGTAALGSRGAKMLLRRSGHGGRLAPAVGAIGGVTAGVASLPVSNRVARRQGYEVTPTGVKRRKTPPVRPTRSARVVETRPGRGATPFSRGQIVPSDDRFGKRAEKVHYAHGTHGHPACGSSPRPTTHVVSSTRNVGRVTCQSCAKTRQFRDAVTTVAKYYGEGMNPKAKRAKVIAAGATPLIGPYAAGAQAARMAPPEQKRSAAITQTGGIIGGSVAGGLAGAYTAAKSPSVERQLSRGANKINSLRSGAAGRMPGKVGRLVAPKTGEGRIARHVQGMVRRAGPLGRPLARNPKAAALGYLSGKAVGTAAGGYLAYSQVLRREKERNMSRVQKAVEAGAGMTQREQREQYRRRRHNLGLSLAATGLGAAGAGALAARELGPHLPRVGPAFARHTGRLERAGLATALLGGAVGSAQGVQSARIQRKDLAAQDKVLNKALRTPSFRSSTIAIRRSKNGMLVPIRRANTVSKIDTTISRQDADKIKAKYGLRGPLPKDLSREQKMHAYEGRYVAAGGPKGERWQHRADDLDHATGAALGVGGAGALTQLHAETKAHRLRAAGAPAKVLAPVERRAMHSGKIGLAAAGVGALTELGHRHAQHRAASYRSSPAGVAASALRRMRDYTP